MVQKKEDIKIRYIVEDDIPKIEKIDKSIVGNGRVTTWPFSFEAYWKIYRPNVSLVAEYKGEDAGFLLGTIEQEERSLSIFSRAHSLGPPSRNRRVGWIDMMGISPNYWHRGIGQALVEAFNKECQKVDATMRIIVRESDEGLRQFLTNTGFKKWEVATYER